MVLLLSEGRSCTATKRGKEQHRYYGMEEATLLLREGESGSATKRGKERHC